MVLVGAVTVTSVSGVSLRISLGLLLAVAEATLLLCRRLPQPFAAVAILTSCAASLAALFLTPRGLAEVPVLIAASVLPYGVPERMRVLATLAVSVLFGVALLWISHTPAAPLASVSVWFVAERTLERRELAAERDRAVTLLAEVQASRDAQARAAGAEERGRIAREMHDVLAHSLAGLSLQLQAVRASAPPCSE